MVCRTCGLEHVHPRPTLDDLRRIYTESYYDAWNLGEEFDSVGRLKQRTSRGHLEILARWKRKGRILDVGCATGFFLMEAKRHGWSPYGVELSEYAAKEAKRLIGDDRIYHGMVEQCPYPDGSFDAISMMDCIEHVLDINGVMAAVTRLLAPGGMLLITTPYVGSFTYRAMGAGWTHYKLEHIQYFGRQSIGHLFEQHGLKQVYLAGARKHLSIDYFVHQFLRYQHPLITPCARLIDRLTPGVLRHRTVPLLLGDMLAIARKPKE